MADKVIITTDTGSDLRPENLEKFHIDGMIPFHITLGDKSYLDFYECQPDDLFRFFEEHNQVPKTAACSPHDFYEFFEPFAQQGCDIVHIAMNSVFSSSYANSLIAAEEIKKTYGTSVFSVDTYTLTGAQALMAIRAAELRDGGMPAGQIAEEIRAMIPHMRTNFLLGGMNYAAKGGRCSMLVAFGANLLKLYPMMHIDEK
ncbi:MAG: DegV family EDD domain-containing protein, partial [Clostridia bacterium]|nr:DegV family EDD domain-containing protein [Clostridia bacterium]